MTHNRLPQRVVYRNRIHEVIALSNINERFKFLLCDPEGNYIEADFTMCKALASDRRVSFTNPPDASSDPYAKGGPFR